MDQVTVNLEAELHRVTRDAKNIILLSLISLIALPLFFVALLYFLFYISKLKKLKTNQSLGSIFYRLKGKTAIEQKTSKESSEPLDQRVAGLLLAHKSMVAVLIVVGLIITIMIGIICMSYLMGWQVT